MGFGVWGLGPSGLGFRELLGGFGVEGFRGWSTASIGGGRGGTQSNSHNMKGRIGNASGVLGDSWYLFTN